MTAVAELPRPIGCVLGGGASLGAIKDGMLQALSEHDVAPDLVVGASVGSLNGAALALDPTSGANRARSHPPSATLEEEGGEGVSTFPQGAYVTPRRRWSERGYV